MAAKITDEELCEIENDAHFTSSCVGAPGSPMRARAESILKLIGEFRLLGRRVRGAETIGGEVDADAAITVRIPGRLRNELEREAAELDVPLEDYVCTLLGERICLP